MLKNIPSLTEDFEKYTPLIRLIQFMRGKVDHKDEYFPAKTDLEHVREEIPKFIEWFLKIGRSYYEEAKNFSLVQAFLASARWYVGQADWIQHQYGEKMPYSIKTEIELQEYNSIKTLREKVAAKILQINVIEDLKKDDFDTLIQLIKQIERIDAQESVLLSLNLCPKCGCKIIETHNTINRGGYEAEPVGEVWRIGCEKCDYELNN